MEILQHKEKTSTQKHCVVADELRRRGQLARLHVLDNSIQSVNAAEQQRRIKRDLISPCIRMPLLLGRCAMTSIVSIRGHQPQLFKGQRGEILAFTEVQAGLLPTAEAY